MLYLDTDRVRIEWWIAYLSIVMSEPLKVLNDVRTSQRLQYPSEQKLTMIQRVKENKDGRRPCPPILEVCFLNSMTEKANPKCFLHAYLDTERICRFHEKERICGSDFSSNIKSLFRWR